MPNGSFFHAYPQNLFRDDYDALWDNTTLQSCFPNYPIKSGRAYIQRRVKRLNHLRNRIAHHEPIWREESLAERFAECVEVVKLVSPCTAQWMEDHATVLKTIRFPPTSDTQLPGRPLHSFTFEKPTLLTNETTLMEAIVEATRSSKGAAALVETAGRLQVVEAMDLLNFLRIQCAETGGMFDVTGLTLANLPAMRSVVQKISNSMSTGDALALFFKAGKERRERPTHLAIMDGAEIVGVVRRPSINFGP